MAPTAPSHTALIDDEVASPIDLSIVVPVYNSATTLKDLVARTFRALAPLGLTFEMVFVDDGSRDASWEVLGHLQERHGQSVVAIQLMRNYGQHNTLMCGLRHARGNLLVTMDDDLQNPPEEIPKLIQTIRGSDLDLVYGQYDTKQHRWWRNIGSAVVTLFFRLVFQSPVTVTSFRIMRRELVEATLSYSLNYTFVDGLLSWHTQRVGQVSVRHEPRVTGRSGYSLGKLMTLTLNLFTNFSLLPLQITSLVGVVASLGGLVTGGYYVVQSLLRNITVPGYTSTIVAIFVFGGLQLMALGIIGEYLGRLHLNVNRKPQYTIRQLRATPSRSRAA
jgi:glycosyltransferase involved in cell wall biosynthesis